MPKLNKTSTIIVSGTAATTIGSATLVSRGEGSLINADGISGQSKVTTTAPPESGRVVATRRTTGNVELRYVPLEPNRPSAPSTP